jgi:pimeloyl-ACP methyl ester carboxylesterase
MSEAKTRTMQLPGAVIAYDVREAESESGEPVLLMIGSPMDASGFASFASRFPERTVVTYDPRGVERSPRADGVSGATPDEHAEDVSRLIAELDAGPVDVFGSSGGAVNGLALVARHPEQVRVLVAHEPPLATVIPDRAAAFAATEDIHETYERDGYGAAMAKFIVFATAKGPTPGDFSERVVDPASFGLRSGDDGSRDHPLLGPHMIHVSHYEPDFGALRGASTRIVLARGVESEDMFTYRAANALAERLGIEPVSFPGGHVGFAEQGDPDAFAAVMRGVLADVADEPAAGVRS